jgi:hypothetical protein
MDDTQQYAMFPVGPDLEVKARRPSGGQLLALMPLRKQLTPAEEREITRRFLLVLSKLVGDDQWQIIEDALVLEEISVDDLTSFGRQLASFDGWDAPGDSDTAVDEDAAAPTPRPPRRV